MYSPNTASRGKTTGTPPSSSGSNVRGAPSGSTSTHELVSNAVVTLATDVQAAPRATQSTGSPAGSRSSTSTGFEVLPTCTRPPNVSVPRAVTTRASSSRAPARASRGNVNGNSPAAAVGSRRGYEVAVCRPAIVQSICAAPSASSKAGHASRRKNTPSPGCTVSAGSAPSANGSRTTCTPGARATTAHSADNTSSTKIRYRPTSSGRSHKNRAPSTVPTTPPRAFTTVNTCGPRTSRPPSRTRANAS